MSVLPKLVYIQANLYAFVLAIIIISFHKKNMSITFLILSFNGKSFKQKYSFNQTILFYLSYLTFLDLQLEEKEGKAWFKSGFGLKVIWNAHESISA